MLDASVVLQWFETSGGNDLSPARSIRAGFESGAVVVFAPQLLYLEIVNVAGRRWGWARQALLDLSGALLALGFTLRDPEVEAVAEWTARGMTAYDAAYVAVAASESMPLVTDDRLILKIATDIAISPAAARKSMNLETFEQGTR